VTVIDMYNNKDSLYPMWMQVKKFITILKPIMDEHPEGIHFVCFSQGKIVFFHVVCTCEDNWGRSEKKFKISIHYFAKPIHLKETIAL